MSVLFGATPAPVVWLGDHGQLLSLAPEVNWVESRAPSSATGWTPAVSQSRVVAPFVHRLPSISNPATGEPAAGVPAGQGVIRAAGAAARPRAALGPGAGGGAVVGLVGLGDGVGLCVALLVAVCVALLVAVGDGLGD